MRRIAVLAAFLFLSTSVFAGTQTYVVMMKPNIALHRATEMVRDLSAQNDSTDDVVELGIVNGVAARLTDEEAAQLRRAPGVRYVEAVVERHALGDLPTGALATRNLNGQTVPFGIDAIHAREVWPVTRGESVNVVIVDTGIDYNHPEFAGTYAGGYNVFSRNGLPFDDNGHGTHVAGTIAAADNEIGVVGVAPRVTLWSVKVLDSSGSGSTANVIAGLDWVVRKKAEIGGNWVANFSLGSDQSNFAEQEAFTKAISAGVLVVAASGNESIIGTPAPVGYPAAYPGVFAVGAVDSTGKIATFSNQGPELSVVAPGIDILSTLPMGSGTIVAVQAPIGSFSGGSIDGSKKGTATAPYVFCGLGNPGDFPPGTSGKIAVIRRGTITFAEKAKNAKNAGAAAVVIVNNDTSSISWTLINSNDPLSQTYDWPLTVGLSKSNGDALLAAGAATITVSYKSDDYGVLNGTSMATPHVAGAAALVWAAAPSINAVAVEQALRNAAADLGDAGFDTVYGAGEINVLNAAKSVNPSAFGSPIIPSPQPSGPRRRSIHH